MAVVAHHNDDIDEFDFVLKQKEQQTSEAPQPPQLNPTAAVSSSSASASNPQPSSSIATPAVAAVPNAAASPPASPRHRRYADPNAGSGAASGAAAVRLNIPSNMQGIPLQDLDLKHTTAKGQGSFAKVVSLKWTPSATWVACCVKHRRPVSPSRIHLASSHAEMASEHAAGTVVSSTSNRQSLVTSTGGGAATGTPQSPDARAPPSTTLLHGPQVESASMVSPTNHSGPDSTSSWSRSQSSSNDSFGRGVPPNASSSSLGGVVGTSSDVMNSPPVSALPLAPLATPSSSQEPLPPPPAPRNVAVKIMSKDAVNRSAFTSLQAEVDICSTFSHPCLINTLGIVEDDASIYIVMDLAEGGELFGYTRRFGLEDMPLVAPNFLAEVVMGLEYMNVQHQVVHRDIKPENLLLTSDYHVKIADFGTAIKVDSEENRFTGTPHYVSPEVVKGGKASIRSDIWALGCVLYQLFVGRPPFQGESAYFIMEAIKQRRMEYPPYFPSDAKDLVEKMLTMDPERRIDYPDIRRHPFFGNTDWDGLLKKSNVTFLNDCHDQARWGKYLAQGEKVLFASRIVKERYVALSVKERYLILTDFPRLFYVKEESNNIKGTVPWTEDLCAQADNAQQFHVYTGTGFLDRVYHFVDADNHAQIWAAKINDMVKLHKAKLAAKRAAALKASGSAASPRRGTEGSSSLMASASGGDWVDASRKK